MKLSPQHSRPQQPWHQSGLLMAVCMAIAVWFADQTMGLHALKNAAFDRAMVVRSHLSRPESRVILVLADESPANHSDATTNHDRHSHTKAAIANFHDRIVQSLVAQDVSAIVFAGDPAGLSPELQHRIRLSDGIFLARRALRDVAVPSRPRVASTGNPALDSLPFGLLALPPTDDGVYRTQQLSYFTGTRVLPSIEGLVAGSLSQHRPQQAGHSVAQQSASGHEFHIHFRGRAGTLPTVRAHDLLDGNLLPEMFAGKVALLGSTEELKLPGLSVPSSANTSMLPLEFHGQALNTLLTHSEITQLPPPLELLLMIAVALLTVVPGQQLPVRHALLLGLAVTFLEFVVAICLLWVHCIWLPIGLCVSVQVLCLARLYHQRVQFISVNVRQLMIDMHLKAGRRNANRVQTDPWDSVLQFLQQSFDADTCVCLAAADDSSRLTVRATSDAALPVRDEAFDVRQSPFQSALESRAVLNLSQRQETLASIAPEDDQVQFLMPLARASRVLGFVVLNVHTHVATDRLFQTQLLDYAAEVVELLEHFAETQRRLKPGRRYLTTIPEEREYESLSQGALTLESQLFRLERLFDASQLPMAVYDIFGRLIVANAAIGRLLQSQNLVAGQLTAFELLQRFAEQPADVSRLILRRVLEQGRAEQISIRSADSDATSLLTVRPLQNDRGQNHSVNPAVFGIEGIVFEVLPNEFRRRSADTVFTQRESVHHELMAIDQTWNGRSPHDSQRAQPTPQALNSSTDGSWAGSEFAAPEETVSGGIALATRTSPVQAVNAAISRLSDECAARKVSVEVDCEDDTLSVDAARMLTVEEFAAVLQCLLLDARDRSRISIHITEDAATSAVRMQFRNEGFGMTRTQLQQRIESATRDNPFAVLRNVLEQLESTQESQLSVESKIGRGISMTLTIQV